MPLQRVPRSNPLCTCVCGGKTAPMRLEHGEHRPWLDRPRVFRIAADRFECLDGKPVGEIHFRISPEIKSQRRIGFLEDLDSAQPIPDRSGGWVLWIEFELDARR